MSAPRFPRLYIEAWAAYEALRRLGFADEETTALAARSRQDGPEMFHVVLETQGRRFVCTIGPLDRSFEEALSTWRLLREAIADGSINDDALTSMWRGSKIGGDVNEFAALVLLLKQKGFSIPALTN